MTALLIPFILIVVVWVVRFKLLSNEPSAQTMIGIAGTLFFGFLTITEPFTKLSYLYMLLILLSVIAIWRERRRITA